MTGTPVAAVEVAHLVKRYRGARRNAVDDISFDVPEGQLFCILGPNGAGKTTTVSILTTTLAPTSGRVRIAGRDLESQQAQVRGELGVVCQQPSLDLNLTAEENIRLHAVLYGLYPWRPRYRLMPASYRREVQEMADVLDLSGSLGRRARTLSGGQRRRLEIVRALMHRPRVLFLDEPTAGLDPASRRGLWAYLRQERARSGVTVILTTHYLEEAEAADSVCVLAGGTIIERGSPAEVKERQLSPQLVLDAADRAGLRRELESLGVQVSARQVGANQPAGPLRVPLNGRGAQDIIASVRTNLTRFQIAEPTLEDAYLLLLERAGARERGPGIMSAQADAGPGPRAASPPVTGPRRELSGLLAIAQRDVTKLLRDRPRLAVNLAFPVLLIGGLGAILQPTVGRVTGLSAVTLAFTGVLAASLFQSAAAGMISIVEDRENDFSRELFVTPVSRLTLVGGKVAGETLVALCQGACIVVFALAFGVRMSPSQLALLLGPCLACCLLGGAFGLATIAVLPNQRSAMQIFQFLIIPQYVLGGVLVPLRDVPSYLRVLAHAMPMTYVVNLTRAAYYAGTPVYRLAASGSPLLDAAVIVILFVVLLTAGAAVFGYRERTR